MVRKNITILCWKVQTTNAFYLRLLENNPPYTLMVFSPGSEIFTFSVILAHQSSSYKSNFFFPRTCRWSASTVSVICISSKSLMTSSKLSCCYFGSRTEMGPRSLSKFEYPLKERVTQTHGRNFIKWWNNTKTPLTEILKYLKGELMCNHVLLILNYLIRPSKIIDVLLSVTRSHWIKVPKMFNLNLSNYQYGFLPWKKGRSFVFIKIPWK